MYGRIFTGKYDGVLNYYKASTQFGPSEEDKKFTLEDKKVTVPTLFILTEKDYAIVAAFHLQMMQETVPHLQVERMETGHWAMLEDKEAVEKMLERVGEAN